MEKLKEYRYIILIVLVILGFAFYWFQLRPTIIRKNCFEETRGNTLILREGMEELQDSYYFDITLNGAVRGFLGILAIPILFFLTWLILQTPKWIFYYIYLGKIKPEK